MPLWRATRTSSEYSSISRSAPLPKISRSRLLGALGVFLQHFDKARAERHHRNALDPRAPPRLALDGHDAGDGILGRLRRARETDDHVGLAQPADEQCLLDQLVVGAAAEDTPTRAVAKEPVVEPGRRYDGEGDQEEDDELALVETDHRLEGAKRQRGAIEQHSQGRAALQDVEEVGRRGEPPHGVVEAAISEQQMAENDNARPEGQARR